MSATHQKPQRGAAFQPRVQPWVQRPTQPRVLKERRIFADGGDVPDQPQCGVPSERIGFAVSIPRVAPWAGMHRPVGAGIVFGGSIPGVAPRAGMHRPVGAGIDLIIAQTQKQEAHKKGLMQQLFPSPVEVEA
jgi:hypothetical protein